MRMDAGTSILAAENHEGQSEEQKPTDNSGS